MTWLPMLLSMGVVLLISVAVLAGVLLLAEWARRSRPGSILLHVLLIAAALVTLTPLIWLVAAAFKGPDEFFAYNFFPPPEKLTWHNFRKLWELMPFTRLLMNSFFVSGVIVTIQLFFCSLGGFALAKYEFRGKRLIMLVMLATMMLPGHVLLAPMYGLIHRMGLIDSHWGLVVPGIVTVFGMFLFMQSMRHVPDELLQAGRIDGCSEFGLYWNIALPVSRPMIGAFCLMSFMGNWNNFLWPQIILQSPDQFTLPIGLRSLVSTYNQEWGAMMAGLLVSILPVVVLFFVLQKEFIAGLTAGAVKG